MVYWYKLKTRSPYYQSTYAINHIYFFKKQMHCFFASTLLFLYTFLAIYLVQLYLDSKEIKSVNLKGNQSLIFIGRTDVEAEAPIIWPPDLKNWLTGKDPDAGKDWRKGEKGTEDEMVGWHHDLMNMSVSKLQELVMDREAWRAAVHPWCRKESDMTERLSWTELMSPVTRLDTQMSSDKIMVTYPLYPPARLSSWRWRPGYTDHSHPSTCHWSRLHSVLSQCLLSQAKWKEIL